ncbi:MAG: AMIN domain-containing protein, partial [Desulfobulbaceae bacterium]
MTLLRVFPRSLFLFPLLLCLLAGASYLSAQDLLTNGESSSPASPEYLKAKDYYYLLVREEKNQADRQQWLNGIKDFRKIYQGDPKGELAPNCLFMMAKMYYRMFMRFKDKGDLDNSMASYREIWTNFPENTLADDALFWSGEIMLKDRTDPVQAAKLYTTQVERFPRGDKYFEAASRLRELDVKHHTGLPAALQGKNAYASLVKVLPVKYWSSDDYTRIVIRSSGPVRYSSALAEKQGNKPRRLDIDFVQSTIEEQYTTPVAVRDGLLQQIHSSQYNPTTVRVSLDIEGLSSYKIFSLNDPFRVIVDIHGPQDIIATPKTLPDLKQEHIAATEEKRTEPEAMPALKPTPKKSSKEPGEPLVAGI